MTCYTCRGTLSNLSYLKKYRDMRRQKVPRGIALDTLGLKRICCRVRFMCSRGLLQGSDDSKTVDPRCRSGTSAARERSARPSLKTAAGVGCLLPAAASSSAPAVGAPQPQQSAAQVMEKGEPESVSSRVLVVAAAAAAELEGKQP